MERTPTPINSPASTRTVVPVQAAQPTPTATLIPVQLRIINDLNVREGPGTAYNRVGQLNTGDQVTVIGQNQDGSWLNICCVAGQSGWVINNPAYVSLQGNSEDVQPIQAPTSITTVTPSTPIPTPTAATAAIGSNCNTGADAIFNSLWQRHRNLIGCPLHHVEVLFRPLPRNSSKVGICSGAKIPTKSM